MLQAELHPEEHLVKTVNALRVRNHLGQILQELEATKEPILLSKDRKVRAALITYEDFQRRFVDRQAEEAREKWRNALQELRAPRVGSRSSLDTLRELRGYPD
jgi:PHD/YefM family antitoxin component YafN of YafNO toxin-antitoxin module